MRPGRLRLTLYLGAFVIAFVGAGLIIGFLTMRPPLRPGGLGGVGPPNMRHVISSLGHLHGNRSKLEAELAQLAREGVEVTLLDSGDRVIGSNVTPPLQRADERTHSYEIQADQRIVGLIQFRPPPHPLSHGRSFVPMAILLIALVLLAIMLARYLGGPLQRIGDAARRFGNGDLSARARVRRADELGEVGRAFDEMADRVTELMTAQRELMANVSHELHTPLARIQVAIDLIIDGIDPRATDLLPQISHELAELQRLIDDIMALSRFDLARVQEDGARAPLRLQPSSLAVVLEEAVARFRARHPTRIVELQLDDLPLVFIDPVLVRRVVENLLDNASKYSDLATSIEISAVASEEGVSIRVADHGIGIDGSDLQRVFTPFFRTDRSRSRATGGFGLGLAFARRVIEAHGGTIQIVSRADEGTTVSFRIPVRASGRS